MVYPLITPFLSSSAGGLQVSTSVLALVGAAVKPCGGPLGTVKKYEQARINVLTEGWYIYLPSSYVLFWTSLLKGPNAVVYAATLHL